MTFFKDYSSKIKQLEDKLTSLSDIVNKNEISLVESKKCVDILKERIDELQKDFINFCEDSNLRIKKVNNLVTQKIDENKEDVESILIGLEKTFSNKLNSLSSKDTTVTDCLKKIAKLEAIKNVADNRRSNEEVLNRLNEVKTQILELDRLGKSIYEKDLELKILEWVVGDGVQE